MSSFLPLMIDLADKNIVIFGGGKVGERKASLFMDHARVTVMSRDFTERLTQLNENRKIKLIQIKDMSETDIRYHLKDAFIAIPATNDAIMNETIARIADEEGTFVNRVDKIGNIIIPSVIKRNDIVIGISTGGHSPALSKYIRQRIEQVITPEFAGMSRLQNEVREILKSSLNSQKKRKNTLWNIINDNDVWKGFEESYEKAFMIALKHIRQE